MLCFAILCLESLLRCTFFSINIVLSCYTVFSALVMFVSFSVCGGLLLAVFTVRLYIVVGANLFKYIVGDRFSMLVCASTNVYRHD